MNGTALMLWTIVAFAVQLLLCFLAKRRWLRLLPVFLQVAMPVVCFAAYALSDWTNWGWLILAVLQVWPFLGICGAWLIYGIWKLLCSRKK